MKDIRLLDLGRTAEKSLEALLEELRKVKKLGYLHIFQHGVDSHPLRGSQERFVRYLLAQAQASTKDFAEEARKVDNWREHYVNPAFTLKSIEILVEQLERINLDGDLTAVVTTVENICNNLHVFVTEFEQYLAPAE